MTDELSRNERIKEASDHLRGTLAEGLREEITGAISEDDQQLVKFHGMYLQDDRDLRAERGRKKMEKAFSFMLRVRISGGVLTPEQWLALDRVARDYGNGTMRITTRQTIQLHGVIKSNLKSTLKAIDTALLNTIAACGDVNRNVMCNPNPFQSRAHAGALELARAISDHLTPRTGAYREIWLDGERIAGGEEEEEAVEPIYGKTYLPRKFKIAVAVPPSNDVDVFANDLSFIALVDAAGTISGWNVTAGGGMGMTHGEPDTYPRTADMLGFVGSDKAVAVAEAVVTVQRDWGNRSNRKHARLKYTIEDRGLDAFRAEVEKRAGVELDLARPCKFTSTGDRYGWTEGEDGRGHLTLFVENGRVRDAGPGRQQLAALRRIAELNVGDVRLTANQNVIIANVPAGLRDEVNRIAAGAGLLEPKSGLRRNAMACVALPSCGLALAESERYLPALIDALDARLKVHGLEDDDIVLRMTGCPNGCARPYLAEIGLVGKGPGRYNLYLGAAFDGSRLSKLYAEDLDHEGIIAALDPVLAAYAARRQPGERFGEFTIRAGFVARTGNGRDFHANVAKPRAA
ncbi:MAG: NADPH-dependent assimilatory sulfite reductase hemoprotein subunit [Xanthobacteraceae bacterium]|nr:NADPH-dependent assimilatory sulfite reductase hemoprotein subunit [Xanthobacteraceae bacterium]